MVRRSTFHYYSTIWLTFVLVIYSPEGYSQNLTASIASLHELAEYDDSGRPHGGFVDLVRAIDDKYTDGSIKIGLFPFRRSIANVTMGKADFHLPLIRSDQALKSGKRYHYVSEPITKVAFVLYTRSTDLDEIDFERMEDYKVATLAGHSHLFPFQIDEVETIHSGIKMLITRRDVDALLLPKDSVDRFILKHKILNISRRLYRVFDASIVVANTPQGRRIEDVLVKALKELKAEGRLQEITAAIHTPYRDWQPSEVE